MIRLGLLGLSGKMGARVQSLVVQSTFAQKIKIVASPERGTDLKVLESCDVILDFSSPERVLQVLDAGIRRPMLLGSTGWTEAQFQALERFVPECALFLVPNFSVGVSSVRSALRALRATGAFDRYSVRMREEHHVHKKDAPSGTALSLAKELPSGTPIESVREGETIGIHEIILESPFERIEIRHEAKSRDLFAAGALECAIALAEMRTKFSGRIYTLEDLFSV